MTALASPVPGTLADRWERWTHASHHFVLPAAAATGLALGGALALGAPRILESYAPLALIALGAGALGSSVAYRRWTTHRSAAQAAAARAPKVATPPAPCPKCVEAEANHREWTDLVQRAWHAPVVSPSPARGLSAELPLKPGDRIWQTWAHTEPSRLPVELVPPVPETAWVEPAAGAFVPFPQKEPELRVVEGRVVPMPPPVSAPAPAPGLGVVPAVTPVLVPPSPVPLAVPPAVTVPLPSAVLSGLASVGLPGELAPFALGPDASVEDWLLYEAMHPLPPHLRPEGGATWTAAAMPAVPTTVPATESPEFTVTCATCAQSCDEDAAWGPCPECGEPVCPTCRIRAVVEYGHTWCSGCGVGRAWENSFTSAPAAAGS